MTKTHTIRETGNSDIDAILDLYPKAFPDEDLRPVVSELLSGEDPILSLAAFEADRVTAHVLFTLCSPRRGDLTQALLAPLGVIPSHQGRGLGSTIVREGVSRLRAMQRTHLYVLGDPAYYGRFGFETERQVQAPYPIPEEWATAWQSMALSEGGQRGSGRLILPDPWMRPELW